MPPSFCTDLRSSGRVRRAPAEKGSMANIAPTSEQELREQAVKRLKRKRDFRNQLISYVIINAFLVAVWALADGGYFWPGWVMAGWGVGLVFSAWNAYGRPPKVVTEEQIKREMDDLKKG